MNLLKQRLIQLGRQINSIERDIEQTQGLIKDLSKEISKKERGIEIILLQNTLPNYHQHLQSLLNQKTDLQMSLSKAKEFKVISIPICSETPIKPKKRQNVAIAGVISLFFGVVVAFFIEYWQKKVSSGLGRPKED